MRRRIAEHYKLDSWNILISFNLGQSESSNLVANAKVEGLDMTLDDLARFADES